MGIFSKKKHSLKAVYEADLVKYLQSLGLYDAIVNGDKLCRYCGRKLTIENLEIIIPSEREIEFVCNNKNCLNQL